MYLYKQVASWNIEQTISRASFSFLVSVKSFSTVTQITSCKKYWLRSNKFIHINGVKDAETVEKYIIKLFCENIFDEKLTKLGFIS